jgi:hypothetical protein
MGEKGVQILAAKTFLKVDNWKVDECMGLG